MSEYEVRQLIREMMQETFAPVMMGKVLANAAAGRTSILRTPSDSGISGLRNIQPWGFASRAPAGTDALVIPVDRDATHLNVVGQFNPSAPALADGESVFYGADGQLIYAKTGGTIHQGSMAAAEPVVLGNVLLAFLGQLLDTLTQPEIVGYDSLGGPVQLEPGIRETLIQLKETFVTEIATNVVGQKNFVERGV